MSSEKTNGKKKLVIVMKYVVYVFSALLLILGCLVLMNKCLEDDDAGFDYTDKEESIFYFSADYDENMSTDLVYMSFDRKIYFTDPSGFTCALTEDNTDDGSVSSLMYRYFTALFSGDADAHAGLFTEQYKNTFKLQTRFTPQKVYDINVSYLTSDSGKDIYRVVYKIYENNGSYRADIGSNVAKIMAFEIDKTSGVPLINSIGYISDK